MGGMPEVEWLEERFPVRVLEYAVRPGSGGAGRYRGGMGVTFAFEVLRGEAVLTVFGDRCRRGAQGLRRGARGACARMVITRRDASAIAQARESGKVGDCENRISLNSPIPPFSPSAEGGSGMKAEGVILRAGDRVRIDTPGGGGYGHPYERAIRLVTRDVEDGLLTRREAAVQHGVILYQDSLDYDSPKTFQLRNYPLAVADIEGMLEDDSGPVKE